LRRQQDRTFHFGFGYLPNTPTATPRPPPPTCTVYKIGNADRYDVTDVAVAADGTVWASTFNHGVARYVPAKDEFVYLTDGPDNPQVRSITVSGANAVWFATEGGAARFDGRWTTYTTRDGLIDNSVYQVAIAPDGSYWFATRGGVSHFKPNENTWTKYTPEQGLKSVGAIAAMPDGSVWVSTLLNGLYRLVPDNAQTKDYKVVAITGGSSGDIKLAPDGSYWFATSRGVERFDPRTSIWTMPSAQTRGSTLDGYVNALAFAPDGSLWIASTNTASDSAKIYHYIPPRAQGSLDSWRVYDTRNGLPKSAGRGDRAKSIAVANDGAVWVASQDAVTRCVFTNQ
jgi:streptogramin lyase